MNVNHYYDHIDNYDNDDNNDETIFTTKYFDNLSSNHIFTSGTLSRHDKKIWNKIHLERLNSYENFGNLDGNDIHLDNSSYNSLRSALDRKGFKKLDKAL